MEAALIPLLPLFERERAAGRAFVLAVVVHTSGSTYRKAGALMAIAGDGSYAGLLSGGCLESDLGEHARAVMATGTARLLTYSTGGADDLLWGLGIGCEGTMQVMLLRVDGSSAWQPLAHLAEAHAAHRATAFGVAVESTLAELPAGGIVLPEGHTQLSAALAREAQALLSRSATEGSTAWLESSALRLLAVPLALPARLLLLGGGPDALPIVDLAARLGWRVTVVDHRPSYAQSSHFPQAERVVLTRPEELARSLDLRAFEAAVIMSHHLGSDLIYLRTLASSAVGYLGLLGPTVRRDRLLAELQSEAAALRQRLRSPVGLDLGGRAPEAVALAVVAEIQAHLHGRSGASLSG
jgi:xanthine/CO dehydrogenase XdhC/CoxF family maturation factor